MAVKKSKAEKPKAKDGPEISKAILEKNKQNELSKPNIAQAGIMRALKARDYVSISDSAPFVFTKDECTIEIHADKAVVIGTDISVPLGKGAITKLIKQMERKK
jgi:hypothetical protein